MLDEEQQLIAKLRKIEALFARPSTEGERRAAESASNRIRARLSATEAPEPAVEFRFSLNDAWSRSLFTAVLRRHGLTPYRYRGQRRSSLMVRVVKSYLDATLWPEFVQLQADLPFTRERVSRAMCLIRCGLLLPGADELLSTTGLPTSSADAPGAPRGSPVGVRRVSAGA